MAHRSKFEATPTAGVKDGSIVQSPGDDQNSAPAAGGPPPLLAALACRCPRCGNGRLFATPFTLSLAPSCKSCGLGYGFADSGDGPAVFAIFILGAVVLGLAMVAEFKYGVPLWGHVLLWGIGTPVIALGLLRWLKSGLVTLQYRNRAGEAQFEDGRSSG